MATMNAVVRDLRRELSTNIQSLTPNRKVESEKDWVEYISSNGKTIRDTSPEARTFEIGEFSRTDNFGFGGSIRQTVGEIEITFAYPSTEPWSLAAQDDMMAIDTYFLVNPSTVTGCSNRWVNPLKPLRVEDSQEDARKFYVLTVLCYLETTL